jgi:hypothetical protein
VFKSLLPAPTSLETGAAIYTINPQKHKLIRFYAYNICTARISAMRKRQTILLFAVGKYAVCPALSPTRYAHE